MNNKFLFDGYQAAVVTSGSNLYYTTQFLCDDAVAVFTADTKVYFTDKRYLEEAQQKLLSADFQVVDIGGQGLIAAVAEYIKTNKIKTIGIEQNALTLADFLLLRSASDVAESVDISEELAAKRMIKTPDELQKIRQAQQITDTAYQKVLTCVKEGMTERELAAELEFLLRINGADGLAFPSIVAFGKNTSKPHARPTDRPLKKRDFITLDFGAKFEGYCSDMTRTFCYYAVTEEMSDCYYLVLEAQLKALAKARAGMRCKDLDAVSRNFFKDNYVDERFLHSLGHSLGIDIHEAPRISKNSNDILLTNMVYSVEPGLYFAGKFGVRIEDIVIQRENSVENLTNSEKQLIIVK